MLARWSPLTRWLDDCLWRLGLEKGVSRAGLGKRHRSQTRKKRCCALHDHSFRHTAACHLLCPGWSHWGFCSARAESQGYTPGSCLAFYFASTPSVNDRSTLASPFCLLSGTFPRGSTSLVETVGFSWTTPLETVPIDRSPFWLVILGLLYSGSRRNATT